MDIILTPEQAMFLLHYTLGGHGFESGTTKRTIAAVPEGNAGWKPEEHSRSAIELAYHIATSEEWFLKSVLSGSFNWDGEQVPAGITIASIVANYEKNVPALVAQVKAMPVEKLVAPISFFGMFNNSAVTYLGFMLNHTIHHRGQLSAYLRPMGGKVPNIYGGSYDEPMQG